MEVMAGSSWQACPWMLDHGDGCKGGPSRGAPPNHVGGIGGVLGISLGAAHLQRWWGQAPDTEKKSLFFSGKVSKNSSQFGAMDAQLLSSPGAAHQGQPYSAAGFVLWNFSSHLAWEKPRGWGCHPARGSVRGCMAVRGCGGAAGPPPARPQGPAPLPALGHFELATQGTRPPAWVHALL